MSSRTVTLVGYAVLAAALVTYELVGLVWRRTPTLGEAVTMATRSRVGRWALLGAWLWLGWHLFVRTA